MWRNLKIIFIIWRFIWWYLGEFHTKPVHLDLKEGAIPKHYKPFPAAKIYEDMLKKELERLYKIGLLYKCSISIWIAPTVLIPKKKGMVRFLSDFRYLNKCLFRRPYLIPKIAGVLQNFGEICDATSLDLNMGCYTVQLDPYSQKLCTIIM